MNCRHNATLTMHTQTHGIATMRKESHVKCDSFPLRYVCVCWFIQETASSTSPVCNEHSMNSAGLRVLNFAYRRYRFTSLHLLYPASMTYDVSGKPTAFLRHSSVVSRGSNLETHHIGSTVAHWTLRKPGRFCNRCCLFLRIFNLSIGVHPISTENFVKCAFWRMQVLRIYALPPVWLEILNANFNGEINEGRKKS